MYITGERSSKRSFKWDCKSKFSKRIKNRILFCWSHVQIVSKAYLVDLRCMFCFLFVLNCNNFKSGYYHICSCLSNDESGYNNSYVYICIKFNAIINAIAVTAVCNDWFIWIFAYFG